jgi:hypothetical protein
LSREALETAESTVEAMNAFHFVGKRHLVMIKGILVVFVRIEGCPYGPIRIHDLFFKGGLMILFYLDGKRTVVQLRNDIGLAGVAEECPQQLGL